MRKLYALGLVILMVTSTTPVASAQGGDTLVDTLLRNVDDALEEAMHRELPGTGQNLTGVQERADDEAQRLRSVMSNTTNRTLENASEALARIEELRQREAQPVVEAVERRANATRQTVLRNASPIQQAANETALLPAFHDPIHPDATPPVVGLNTHRYYTLPPLQSTPVNAPSIRINETTWRLHPDAWLHWALGEEPGAMDALGLPFHPTGHPDRATAPGGYPGDHWRLDQDPTSGSTVWTLTDPERGGLARGTTTELVSPVIDLRYLPGIDTDQLDDVAEEALNLDPDDLADRARRQGASLFRVGEQAFLSVDNSTSNQCIWTGGQPVVVSSSGVGTGESTLLGFSDTCPQDERMAEVGVQDRRAVTDLESVLNLTGDTVATSETQRSALDRLLDLFRGPVRAIEDLLESIGDGALEVYEGFRGGIRSALDALGRPESREPEESDAAMARLVVQHRFNLHDREDGANLQISIFDERRNQWTPWRLLRPLAGPSYHVDTMDAEDELRPATPSDPAILSLKEDRSAWAGEPLNPRGLGWSGSSEGFRESIFDLSPYAGFQVRIRFFAASSGLPQDPLPGEGWSIEEARVEVAAHSREVAVASQVVPENGAQVLPWEPLPVTAKVRNYGRTPVETAVACSALVVTNGDPGHPQQLDCGSTMLELAPAQETLVRFPPLTLQRDTTARITVSLHEPSVDPVRSPLPDTLADNNLLVHMVRGEPVRDIAIDQVRAIPLEEVRNGIQPPGAPWRLLVTVENRGNAPFALSPQALDLSIENVHTDQIVARLEPSQGMVTLDRGPQLVGPGLPSGANRHTFSFDWSAPQVGLYRLVAKVDAFGGFGQAGGGEDADPGNDKSFAWLPVGVANTGAFGDGLDEGIQVTDRRFEDETIEYPSRPLEIERNGTRDDMEGRALVASGAWLSPPSPEGTVRWITYQGPSTGAGHRNQQPLDLHPTDRTVAFDLWGELERGARLEALWCPKVHTGDDPDSGCLRSPAEDEKDDPLQDPGWVPLIDEFGAPAVITDKPEPGWERYVFQVDEPPASGDGPKGYLALVHISGADARPLLLDDLRLPVKPHRIDGKPVPALAGPVKDTVDYAARFDGERIDRYVLHDLADLEDETFKEDGETDAASFRAELAARVRLEASGPASDHVEGHKAWVIKGHVRAGAGYIVHGLPGSQRAVALPTPIEDDWHVDDGSGHLWWGLSNRTVRSTADSTLTLGPIDLRDVADGLIELVYRGWLEEGSVEIAWRASDQDRWRTLTDANLPAATWQTEQIDLRPLAGERVHLRLAVTTGEDGQSTLTVPASTPGIEPFALDRITVLTERETAGDRETEGDDEEPEMVTHLEMGFERRPGQLQGGLSFYRGQAHTDEGAWYPLYGQRVAPTNGESYFAAFPRYQEDANASITEPASTKLDSLASLSRLAVKEVLCLEDPIDLSWSVRPALSFDQVLHLNSPRQSDFPRTNDVQSFDVALVQVRTIGTGEAARPRAPLENPEATAASTGDPQGDMGGVRGEHPPCDLPEDTTLDPARGLSSDLASTAGRWTTVMAFKQPTISESWSTQEINLQSFVGHRIQIRFVFALANFWTETVILPHFSADGGTFDERLEGFQAGTPPLSIPGVVARAEEHKTFWLVDRVQVVGSDGRPVAPFDQGDESLAWNPDAGSPDLPTPEAIGGGDGAKVPEVSPCQETSGIWEMLNRPCLPLIKNQEDLLNEIIQREADRLPDAGSEVPIPSTAARPWNIRQAFEPNQEAWRFGLTPHGESAYLDPFDANRSPLWHRGTVPGTGESAWLFSRERTATVQPAMGFWSRAVLSAENGREIGGTASGWDPKQPHDHPARDTGFLPPQRLVTPVVDVGDLEEPALLLRHAYNGSFLANNTIPTGPNDGCGPGTGQGCAEQWSSVTYLVEGRYEAFDGSWSPWLMIIENLGRPDARVAHYRGSSGEAFPTFVTDQVGLASLLPEGATGRVQLAFRAANPQGFTSETRNGWVHGGWAIDSVQVADGTAANDVALTAYRLEPAIGRLLVDDRITEDGSPVTILPPGSAVTLNVTLTNRGLFSQDPVVLNTTWGEASFRTDTRLASTLERGASVRSLEVSGLTTPALEIEPHQMHRLSPTDRVYATAPVPHAITLDVELPHGDELDGDNGARIPAVVAAVWKADLVTPQVLPRVDQQDARRVVTASVSNDGNVVLGPSGEPGLATSLDVEITCEDRQGRETTTELTRTGLPPIPPRSPRQLPQPLPLVELPSQGLPTRGTCETQLTLRSANLILDQVNTTFEVAPVLAGDPVDQDSLDRWTRTGSLGDHWQPDRKGAFSPPAALRYTQPAGSTPGQAILESPPLPAHRSILGTDLTFAYNASLGVGDLAWLEALDHRGEWQRISWKDPTLPGRDKSQDTISGSTGLRVVTIPDFGVEPTRTDVFPPANVPRAGSLEPVPIMGYEPRLEALEPASREAPPDAWAASDGSQVLPHVGESMWHLDRSKLPVGSERAYWILRPLTELPESATEDACLSWAWRGELEPDDPSTSRDGPDRATVTLVPRSDPHGPGLPLVETFSTFPWQRDRATIPLDQQWTLRVEFSPRSLGHGPSRGLWLDDVRVVANACNAPPGINLLQDPVERATLAKFETGGGWQLVQNTAAGQPFALQTLGRDSDRSIGARDLAGLPHTLNATLLLPPMDLTHANGSSVMTLQTRADLEPGRDGFWMEYSARKPGGAWSPWSYLNASAHADQEHEPFIAATGVDLRSPICGSSDQDTCTGAFASLPHNETGERRLPMFTGRTGTWQATTVDLSALTGHEVRMAVRLATDGQGTSTEVLFDDFRLETSVLRGIPQQLRFVVDSQGRTPGSTLMVDHVQLLGEDADTNVGLRIHGIDGVPLEDRGRVDGRYVVHPGKVTSVDLSISNTGRAPACNLAGGVSLQSLGKPPVSFRPVGWSLGACLAPGEQTHVTVPLRSDAGGALPVPDPDPDDDGIPASLDPDARDHLPYALTSVVSTPSGDQIPQDDTARLDLIAKPVREVISLLEPDHVEPRIVGEDGTTTIATRVLSQAGVPLDVRVQPILISSKPGHDHGWGTSHRDNWTRPAEHTGASLGLEPRELTLAPGEMPLLTWDAKNLSRLDPGLYELRIETIVDAEGTLERTVTRTGSVPVWLQNLPIYLRATYEAKQLDGILSEQEWSPMVPVELTSQEQNGTDPLHGGYQVEIEEGTLYVALQVHDPAPSTNKVLFLALDGSPVGTLLHPEDAVALRTIDGTDGAARDLYWTGSNSQRCSLSPLPPSPWCPDQSHEWDAVVRVDEDNGTITVELARPLVGDGEQDLRLEPGSFTGLSIAYQYPQENSNSGLVSVDGGGGPAERFTWPPGVDPVLPEQDQDGHGNATGWHQDALPPRDGLAPVGDPADEDENPYNRAGGNEPYWRRANGPWRWQNAFLTLTAETCDNGIDDDGDGNVDESSCVDEGGGQWTSHASGGETGAGDGAWSYQGPSQQSAFHSADALVSPVFHLTGAAFEDAILRFTHKYAFEGPSSGGTIQLQLPRWVESTGTQGPPDGYWSLGPANAQENWVTLGPVFTHPHARGADGLSPDAFDDGIHHPATPVPGDCRPSGEYSEPCGAQHPLHGARIWGAGHASDGWVDQRVELSHSVLCQAYKSSQLKLPTPCVGLPGFAEEPIYDPIRNLVLEVTGKGASKQVTDPSDPSQQYMKPPLPVRLRFAVGTSATDGASAAQWTIDDVSVSAFDPKLSVVRTLTDPFNLTLLEGERQRLELVVTNAARVPDTVRLEPGFKGPRAPAWTLGFPDANGTIHETLERTLEPGERWRVPAVIEPAVGVLTPHQSFTFHPTFTARSLLDPLAANRLTFNVDHGTTLHPELLATRVTARTQQASFTSEEGRAFVNVPVTVQGTLVNLGLQDADGVEVALEVTDPSGNISRVPAASGANTTRLGLLTGGGGLARAAFEWRPAMEGRHTLAFLVDPGDAWKEADERNNRREVSVLVDPLPLPDVQVTGLTLRTPEGEPVDGPISEDTSIRVVATILNAGRSAAKDVRVEFRAGNELFWTERGGPLTTLEPDTLLEVTAPWTAFTPQDPEVDLRVLAIPTPGEGALFDADLEDNQRARTVTIQKPELHLAPARTTVGATPGSVFTVPVRLENRGNAVDIIALGANPEDPLKAAYYPGRSIPLAPGHGVEAAIVVAVPPLTPAGTYEIEMDATSSVGHAAHASKLEVRIGSTASFTVTSETPSLAPGGDELRLRLLNTGNERLRGQPELNLTAGWTITEPLPALDLAPGDVGLILARLARQAPAEPGPQEVQVTLPGSTLAPVSVGLEVRSEGQIHVRMTEPMDLKVGRPVTVPLEVSNVGNQPVTGTVEVDLNATQARVQGLPMEVTLEPGQKQVLDVHLDPLENLAHLPVRTRTVGQDTKFSLEAASALPDLAIERIELGNDPVAGDPVVLLVHVTNQGDSPTEPTNVSLYVDEVLAGIAALESIPPGEERVTRLEVVPALGLNGLTAIVDEAGELEEASLENNAHHATIEAGPPGLLTELQRTAPGPSLVPLLLSLAAVLLWGQRRRDGRE